MHERFDLGHEDLKKETLNADKMKFSGTFGATDRLSKKLLTSSKPIAAISTFVRRKTEIGSEGKKCSTAIEPEDQN